jgi:hypothetical protein
LRRWGRQYLHADADADADAHSDAHTCPGEPPASV